MSTCRIFSCVIGRGCLLWPVRSLGKTLYRFNFFFYKLLIVLKNSYNRKSHLCFFYSLQLTNTNIRRQRNMRKNYLGVTCSWSHTWFSTTNLGDLIVLNIICLHLISIESWYICILKFKLTPSFHNLLQIIFPAILTIISLTAGPTLQTEHSTSNLSNTAQTLWRRSFSYLILMHQFGVNFLPFSSNQKPIYHATAWMKLKNIMASERNQSQDSPYGVTALEMLRLGNSIEQERGDCQKVQGFFSKWCKSSKLILVMAVQPCECNKNHWIVHFKS